VAVAAGMGEQTKDGFLLAARAAAVCCGTVDAVAAVVVVVAFAGFDFAAPSLVVPPPNPLKGRVVSEDVGGGMV